MQGMDKIHGLMNELSHLVLDSDTDATFILQICLFMLFQNTNAYVYTGLRLTTLFFVREWSYHLKTVLSLSFLMKAYMIRVFG